jgi:hypothetical protein
MSELWKDAQQLARRQPELFVAGALAAGFLAGRFFKSSAAPQRDRYNARVGWQDRYNQGRHTQGEWAQRQSGAYAASTYPYGDVTARQNEWSDAESITQEITVMESEGNYAR